MRVVGVPEAMGLDRLAGDWFGTDAASTSEPAPIAGELEDGGILVPLLTPEIPTLADQIKVATTLARANDSPLHVVNPISVPEQTPKGLGHEVSDEADAELLDWAITEAGRMTDRVDGGMLYTRRLVNGVLHAISTNDVDTVVLPGHSAGHSLTGDAPERVAGRADCDTVVVNGRPGFDRGPSILLPVAGGPHSGLAADVAGRIAADAGAWVDVLHVVEEGATDRERERAEEYVEAASRRIGRPETTATWILEAEDLADAIIEQSRYYPLTVVGAPTKGRLRRFIHGSTNRSVRSNARSVVLSARNNTGTGSLRED